jgi:broad specificity phosphatase PhoE
VSPVVLPALQEVDFGEWTGRAFEDLAIEPRWQHFNRDRGASVVPGGEQLQATQQRIVRTWLMLSHSHEGQCIAMVSHAELIRCALLRFMHQSLDDYDALTIAPASVSEVRIRKRSVFVTIATHGQVFPTT